MKWAGTEPVEPATSHEDCECGVCRPPCAIEGCWSFDVTERAVELIPTTSPWSSRYPALMMLCDEHWQLVRDR